MNFGEGKGFEEFKDLGFYSLTGFFLFSKSKIEENEKVLVTKEDLEHMCQLVEERDEGPAWQQMMERSMPNMRYQAWKREPKVMSGI